MNINKLIIDTIKDATSLPVSPDEYGGKATEYVIFTYTDEKPSYFGDNDVLVDTAYVQIQLISPKSFNYLTLKDTIKYALEDVGFIVTSVRSFLGDAIQGTEKIRQTIFECSYTEQRGV